jgi:general stress protein 26
MFCLRTAQGYAVFRLSGIIYVKNLRKGGIHMTDLEKRILTITRFPHLSGFATITEEGRPWVRYVMAVGSEDMSLRFASYKGSRKLGQIALNPEAHLTCGILDPRKMSPYLQIQGRAGFTTDREERHGFWNDMLKPIFSGPDDPNYGVVVVVPYRIEYCIPGTFVPEVWVRG